MPLPHGPVPRYATLLQPTSRDVQGWNKGEITERQDIGVCPGGAELVCVWGLGFPANGGT